MDDTDCKRIAKDANINYESSIDIFYNDENVFPKYESNMEAVEQLKLFFCPKRCEQKVGMVQHMKGWVF